MDQTTRSMFHFNWLTKAIMIKPEEAREQALFFQSQQGLERKFIENSSLKINDY